MTRNEAIGLLVSGVTGVGVVVFLSESYPQSGAWVVGCLTAYGLAALIWD